MNAFPQFNFDNRKTAVVARVGSHNYGLNNERSDEDYKVFVFPTFDDLYSAQMFTTPGKQSAEMDFTAHDVRKLVEMVFKANLNFIEVLFSNKREVSPNLEQLFDMRNLLAVMNLPALYNATMGMHFEKMAGLYKGTATTAADVERFGFDPKQAHHAMRCLFFLERFMDTRDFGRSIWFADNDPMHKTLMDLKAGAVPLGDFRGMVDEWHTAHKTEAKAFFSSFSPNMEVKAWADEFIKNVVHEMMM